MTYLPPVAIGVVIATSVAFAQRPTPSLEVTRPDVSAVLAGPSTLEVAIAPAGTDVAGVTFFVDGQPACRVTAAPFTCEWDAGSRPDPRNIRVVADLADGRRLVATRRTRPRGLTFGSSVDAVLVPTRVFDARGRFVPGLTADQFVLIEDGQPQRVMSVLAEDAAASVMLALDMSASMQTKIDDLRNAAAMFLGSVRAFDAVSVAAFNENLSVLARPGADDATRRAALARIRPWGGTALFDSLVRAAELLRHQPSPRAIVAFTDGEDVASISSVQNVRAALQRADIVLYLIVGADEPAQTSPTRQLARVADETGGAAWFTPRMDAVGDRFTAIVNDLTNGYVLLYVPDRPVGGGEWRDLKVEVAGHGHAVRARQGYLAVGR